MRPKSIHTLSLVASAIALALPSSSFALGLGRLTLQSSLGQPLSAQIELTSANRDELESLAARIADPSLYRQNNLAYQGVLARARVTLDRGPNGQPVLRVVTPTPVNEPYLDLMVELNWASGRVVREYTFLLDPPGVTAPTPTVDPVTPVRAGSSATTRAAAPAPAPAPSQAGAPSAAGGAGGEGANTYAVRRGDSLARIANQLRPESVSLEQMLVALFRSNPAAFDGNNMNRLRAGVILTVPSAAEVSGTPEPDANRVVRMQAADWRTYRDRVAAGAPVTEAGAARETTGRITTAVEERTPAAQPGRDQVRVSREVGPGKGSTAAVEDAVARDRALKDAQARIAELEKTIKDLQRAVEMRSQTMAQLQNQADTGKAVEPPRAAPVAPAPAALTKAPESGASSAPVVVAQAPTASPKAGSAGTSTPASTPAASTAAAVGTPATATPAPPAKTDNAKTEVAKAAPKSPKTEPGAQRSMFDDLLTNTPSWAVGGGAVVLLAALGALIAARRRKTTSFEDSIISGTDIKSNTVFGSTGGGIVNTGDNSLSSDFSREGISTIDTDEVDPIAEAEVYLAYGRDAQAEEILKDALKKDPQRQEVYLKLLEIHAQHNKPSAFDSVAAELYAVTHGQGEAWQKAAALGRQLDPNNPMFGGEGGAAPAAASTLAAAPARTTEPASSAGRVADAAAVAAGAAAATSDRGMDFKLDEEISLSPTSGRKKAPLDLVVDDSALHDPISGLDFEAQPMAPASQSPERSVASGAIGQGAPMPDGGFDLDFHLDESEKPAPMRPAAQASTPAGKGADAAASLARPQAAIDLDKLDLNFDPDRTTFEDPTPSVLDGQWHDAATKLDLAKAYQEMGDIEGAREILQEVLHEGDEQQKGEAGALLQKLA